MRIATRDLLAELLIEALDDPITATALHCLAQYSRAATPFPSAITVEQLLGSIPTRHSDSVLAKLQSIPLLAWDLSEKPGHVTVTDAFITEWQEIKDKLVKFSTALQEWAPNTKDPPLQHALKKGVLFFNHHLFFEVHEVLEAQWRLETGEEKRFLQGLIQIAVAFYHRERGNLRGALLLLQDGIEKLAPHQPTFLGVDLSPFITEIKRVRNSLHQDDPEEITPVRALTAPRLNFITNPS